MQQVEIPPDDAGSLPRLAFGPDGRILLVGTRKRDLLLDTVEWRWLPPTPGDHGQFVHGGRAVASVLGGRELAVTDLHTRKSERRQLSRANGRGLVASPNGEALYLLAHLYDEPVAEVWAYDATTLERRAAFARHNGNPWAMVGAADGRRLAIGDLGGRGERVRVWDTAAVDRPGAAVTSVAATGTLQGFELSADGARMATVSTRGVTLWDAGTGAELFASGKHRCAVGAVSFSPTQPLMATGDSSGHVFLWDYSGRVVARHDWGTLTVYALAFAPDGLRCAAANAFRVVVWDLDI